jgi:hypothetical protein
MHTLKTVCGLDVHLPTSGLKVHLAVTHGLDNKQENVCSKQSPAISAG